METLGTNPSPEEQIDDSFHYQKIGRIEAYFDEASPGMTVSGETSDGQTVKLRLSPNEVLELAELVARNQDLIRQGVQDEEAFHDLYKTPATVHAGEGPEPIPTNKSLLHEFPQEPQP